MDELRGSINIIGAGLSGLSAAITLAEAGLACNLISSQPSERAQSVLAEGGINAALDTMGENDTTDEHFADTMKGGCYLESEEVIRGLVETAPDIVRWLDRLGVPFNAKDGRLVQRNFGGQAKKRTAYARSSTGKMLMSALIDECRRYETEGLVTRFDHHELVDMHTVVDNAAHRVLTSIIVRDSYTGELTRLGGVTILCTGGLNGFFEGITTGTTQNTGNAAAIAFAAGVEMADLEFIQYHPTTVGISNKRMLISEAARGEGGRLYIMRNGEPWYFMEEKYPGLGNLMPRDVVSREMTLVSADPDCEGSVYLDMTALDESIWSGRLSDLRDEVTDYMGLDPAETPIPVSPGIHYFMGGIRVDRCHRTSIRGLYAAGEAACRYHGANRLGGNSMLGAIYGGRIAAGTVINEASSLITDINEAAAADAALQEVKSDLRIPGNADVSGNQDSSPAARKELRDMLLSGLGILRTEDSMLAAAEKIETILEGTGTAAAGAAHGVIVNSADIDRKRAMLGLAMLRAALARKESRGSHTRLDCPDTVDEYRKFSVARVIDGDIVIGFEDADAGFGGDAR